jgi:ComF family protein
LAFHGGSLRNAIHSLKYRRNPALGETLSELMSEYWLADFPADAMLIPVPLGTDRKQARGFNQAEILARGLGSRWRRPLMVDGLRRGRETRSQVGLNAQDRQSNVAGAFVASAKVKGRSVILVDDVCTTGATLSACAEALLQNGAAQVWAYTLARARHDADILTQ